MKDNLTPGKSAYKGRGPVWHTLMAAFIFVIVSATIAPLNNMIARYTLCPGASEAILDDSSGGTVEKPGIEQDVSTTVVSLYCEFEDGSVKKFGNDTIVFSGFGVSAGVGAAVGLVVYLLRLLRVMLSPRGE